MDLADALTVAVGRWYQNLILALRSAGLDFNRLHLLLRPFWFLTN